MSKQSEKYYMYISDEAIIEMYWQREERAITETEVKYGKFLYKIAFNILYNNCDAEECQNDTYLGIWKAIPPVRPIVFPAFATQIVRRIAINRYKEKTCKKRIPSELTSSIDEYESILASSDTVDHEYTTEEVGRIVSDYVNALSERQRYIFIARFYIADSVEDIANDLNISIATVYRELDKLKQELKFHLEKNGVYI